ncbi:cell division protein FtsW [Virgibacillus natechei]|uniref:Probable peptidoglycan glycosyltransferase FtsW n=1 Tax=Virgibacillus natechei TaxID=1216297 RepID=A0ABS4ILV5_9BACI|nr:putative lipid II flippase FtsW [Virgibacillus natechei]MBP1971540.1 cell division protein FtsW [Virgibacillus natechei]UZD11990.1 putative lipid II flippase FtsW [Virgibacillus natechei]
MKNIMKRWDFGLFTLILLMALFGLMMVYSSSFPYAILQHGEDNYFFNRQLIWIVVGFVIFFVVSFIPYQLLGKFIAPLILLLIVLLGLVLVPGIGVERNYSTRWLGVGPFVFQPSEIAKLIMLIYFAKAYSNKRNYIGEFSRGFLPPLLILAFVFFLIIMQPDLGTGISIIIACGGVLLLSGAKWQHLGVLGGLAVSGVAMLAFSADYRMDRMTSFVDPFADPLGQGLQLVNSYIAIGTGGFTGEGLGNSIQKMGYLPEAHTDFIMAIILEELGIIGLIIVMGMFVTFLLKGFDIFKKTPNYFGKFLAFGITIQICFQAILNLGSVSGLLPITGITLPLISYGGSSMVITLAGIGMLMNISMQNNKAEQQNSEEKNSA